METRRANLNDEGLNSGHDVATASRDDRHKQTIFGGFVRGGKKKPGQSYRSDQFKSGCLSERGVQRDRTMTHCPIVFGRFCDGPAPGIQPQIYKEDVPHVITYLHFKNIYFETDMQSTLIYTYINKTMLYKKYICYALFLLLE